MNDERELTSLRRSFRESSGEAAAERIRPHYVIKSSPGSRAAASALRRDTANWRR
jgi:hypothetical protein